MGLLGTNLETPAVLTIEQQEEATILRTEVNARPLASN
jgi:hypothetical protein